MSKFKKVCISAITGRYVKPELAKTRPNTTIVMTVKVGKRS